MRYLMIGGSRHLTYLEGSAAPGNWHLPHLQISVAVPLRLADFMNDDPTSPLPVNATEIYTMRRLAGRMCYVEKTVTDKQLNECQGLRQLITNVGW